MIETIFGKNVLQVYFEVLAWPMSYLTLFKLDFFFLIYPASDHKRAVAVI